MYFAILCAALISFSTALYTPKGSSCTVECGTKAQNFTGTGDLVCLDTAYEDSTKGVLFKQCVTCLSTSTYVNDAVSYNGNSDQFWYLWHVKYVQQYCLIDTPQTAAAKNCASKCDPLQAPLDVSWIYNKAGAQPQYGYCSWNSSIYMTYAEDCATCLQAQEGGVIIGNLADTTYNACKTKPHATNGELVTSSRDLFDSAIIDPSVAATSTSSASSPSSSDSSSNTSSSSSAGISSAISSITSSTTSNSALDTAATGATTATSTSTSTGSAATDASSTGVSNVQSKAAGLSSPAAAGIGVGATLLTLAFAAGMFFLFRRRKRSPALQRLSKPLAYAHELPNAGQVNEIGGGEKHWHKVAVHETGGLPLQELDASGRR